MPKFSVVLISYCQADLVAAAVSSVQSQSINDWEIVAVDDGSSDNTLEVLNGLAARDKRIRVVPADHSGRPSICRNIGLSKVTGDIVCFLDADDEFAPGRFEAVAAAFDAFPDSMVCFGDLILHGRPELEKFSDGWLKRLGKDDELKRLSKRSSGGLYLIDRKSLLPHLISDLFYVIPLNMSLRQKWIQSRRLMFDDEKLLGEDHDFFIRAIDSTDVAFVDRPLGRWFRYPTSLSSSPSTKGMEDSYKVDKQLVAYLQSTDPTFRVSIGIQERLATKAFHWGYSEAREGNFRAARRAYLHSLRHRLAIQPMMAFAKALFRLRPRH